MKKSTSIAVIILTLIVTVLLGITAFVGWGESRTGSIYNIKTGLDLSGGVSITYQTVESFPSQEDMDDTIYKMQLRVETYSTEASVYQQGLDRINVEIPGVTDANAILEEIGKPGSLYFMDTSGNVVLEGTQVASAEGVSYTDSTGLREYVVELTLTADGAEAFEEATEENLGNIIYIVYDDTIISAPTVNSVITGGTCEITGMSDLEEARTLASYIRIGSLSLELEEIYSNVVGASLGAEALSTSMIAGIIGIILVMLFMIVIYRISGLASAWALLIFTFLDLIAMNAFEVTLTLPGIAGVILTIGMAVDANVIIYARAREERFAGRSLRASLEEGFKKAFSAVFDGNITTLIAAVVLYALGTGTIRGFAITLSMGIVLSMFSSLVVSRWLSYAFYGAGLRKPALYSSQKQRKTYDFLGKKKILFAIAIVLILVFPVGMVINSSSIGKVMNFGLDFVGGTSTTVDFGETMTLDELEEQVRPIVEEVTGDNEITFQTITGTTQVVIKTNELDLDLRNALDEALEENFENVVASEITAENISATISGEMRSSAILAVIIAVAAMLVYIWFRFRNIRFASSAVLALIHDLLIVLAFYTIFKLTVSSTFIAVMLTILGYSINATIVIFDRIRENLRVMGTSDIKNVVNASISQTLTRSIYSTITTFIMIFVLYLMGVSSIKEFALPIIIGLIAGTYSSVCLTGAMWYMMSRKKYKQ